MENTSIDTPIFKPEHYTHATERMLAEIHKNLLDVRNRLEVLELAAWRKSQDKWSDDGR
jgi:hypothetical protein